MRYTIQSLLHLDIYTFNWTSIQESTTHTDTDTDTDTWSLDNISKESRERRRNRQHVPLHPTRLFFSSVFPLLFNKGFEHLYIYSRTLRPYIRRIQYICTEDTHTEIGIVYVHGGALTTDETRNYVSGAVRSLRERVLTRRIFIRSSGLQFSNAGLTARVLLLILARV